jgi:hypothetical protein
MHFITYNYFKEEFCNFQFGGFNPLPAEFFKWTCPAVIIGTVHYQFCGHHDETLM